MGTKSEKTISTILQSFVGISGLLAAFSVAYAARQHFKQSGQQASQKEALSSSIVKYVEERSQPDGSIIIEISPEHVRNLHKMATENQYTLNQLESILSIGTEVADRQK